MRVDPFSCADVRAAHMRGAVRDRHVPIQRTRRPFRQSVWAVVVLPGLVLTVLLALVWAAGLAVGA